MDDDDVESMLFSGDVYLEVCKVNEGVVKQEVVDQ